MSMLTTGTRSDNSSKSLETKAGRFCAFRANAGPGTELLVAAPSCPEDAIRINSAFTLTGRGFDRVGASNKQPAGASAAMAMKIADKARILVMAVPLEAIFPSTESILAGRTSNNRAVSGAQGIFEKSPV